MAKLTDESPMPFGAHKGKAMTNVPADYLIYLFRENKMSADVKEYIIDNMDVLEAEVKKSGSKFLK